MPVATVAGIEPAASAFGKLRSDPPELHGHKLVRAGGLEPVSAFVAQYPIPLDDARSTSGVGGGIRTLDRPVESREA